MLNVAHYITYITYRFYFQFTVLIIIIIVVCDNNLFFSICL